MTNRGHAITLNTRSGKIFFQVRLQPRASRTEIAGTYRGAIKIRLTSPPIDNRANRQLEKFLSTVLRISRTSIEIVSGEKSRLKTIAVEGLTEAELHERLVQYVV